MHQIIMQLIRSEKCRLTVAAAKRVSVMLHHGFRKVLEVDHRDQELHVAKVPEREMQSISRVRGSLSRGSWDCVSMS